jgi:hypothetical protein
METTKKVLIGLAAVVAGVVVFMALKAFHLFGLSKMNNDNPNGPVVVDTTPGGGTQGTPLGEVPD